MRRNQAQTSRRVAYRGASAALRSPLVGRCSGCWLSTYRGRGRPTGTTRSLAIPFDQAGPSSSRALALPFAVASKETARGKFQGWVTGQSSMTFDASAIKLVGVKPVYLPFFGEHDRL